jgi:hypothetical protein
MIRSWSRKYHSPLVDVLALSTTFKIRHGLLTSGKVDKILDRLDLFHENTHQARSPCVGISSVPSGTGFYRDCED